MSRQPRLHVKRHTYEGLDLIYEGITTFGDTNPASTESSVMKDLT